MARVGVSKVFETAHETQEEIFTNLTEDDSGLAAERY